MDTKLQEEFNNMVNIEFNSAYLYYAMSTYFDEIYMSGFSTFMKEVALEKLSTAQKMYNYLILRDQKLVFEKIEEPDSDWINISDIFSISLSHEEFVIEKTKELYRTAKNSEDIGTMEFLAKLITKNELLLSKLRKIIFRIKNSNIIPASVEFLDRENLSACLN